MLNQSHIPLVSSELAHLWKAIMSETMSLCVLRYFLATVQDEESKPLIRQLVKEGEKRVQKICAFYEKAEIPVPAGFSDSDVNLEAPPLFTDAFILQYIAFMCGAGMNECVLAIEVSANSELRTFFIKRLEAYTQAEHVFFELLLKKGLFIRAPYLPYPKQVEFVQQQSFLTKWFEDKRALTALEVHHLFINSIRNALGMHLMIAFSQTAEREEIREYMMRGKAMSKEFLDTFDSIVQANDISPSYLVGVGVTDSTVPPFSEKLMLNMVTTLNSYGIAMYGLAGAEVQRPDVSLQLAQLLAKTAAYAAEGGRLLIKYGYLEQPPTAPDREHLS